LASTWIFISVTGLDRSQSKKSNKGTQGGEVNRLERTNSKRYAKGIIMQDNEFEGVEQILQQLPWIEKPSIEMRKPESAAKR